MTIKELNEKACSVCAENDEITFVVTDCNKPDGHIDIRAGDYLIYTANKIDKGD